MNLQAISARPSGQKNFPASQILWPCSPDEVRDLWRHMERYPAGALLKRTLRCGANRVVVLSGWACEMCILPDGRRQIFSIFLPGDAVALPGEEDISVRGFVALTPLGLIDASMVLPVETDGRSTTRTARRTHNQAESRLFVHMIRLGRLSGYERMMHLFLELHERLAAVGLARDGAFRLPLTQEVLADLLGLSVVHVNRTLQQLRREGLITVNRRMLRLNRLQKMSGLASYRGGLACGEEASAN